MFKHLKKPEPIPEIGEQQVVARILARKQMWKDQQPARRMGIESNFKDVIKEEPKKEEPKKEIRRVCFTEEVLKLEDKKKETEIPEDPWPAHEAQLKKHHRTATPLAPKIDEADTFSYEVDILEILEEIEIEPESPRPGIT